MLGLTRQIAVLSTISRLLADVDLGVESALRDVLRHTTDLMADSCTLRLLSSDGRHVTDVVSYHRDVAVEQVEDISVSLLSRPVTGLRHIGTLRTGQQVLMPCVTAEQSRSWVATPLYPYVERNAPFHLLIVPLRVGGILLGSLAFRRQASATPFCADDQSFLQNVADHLALAVANTNLRDEAHRLLAEQRHLQEELRRAEERSRIVAEIGDVLIYDWDLLTQHIEWFGNVTERLHYPPGEFPQTVAAYLNAVHPADRGRVSDTLKQQGQAGKRYSLEREVTSCYETMVPSSVTTQGVQ